MRFQIKIAKPLIVAAAIMTSSLILANDLGNASDRTIAVAAPLLEVIHSPSPASESMKWIDSIHEHLVRHWSVSEEAAREILQTTWIVSTYYQIDPLLLLAIMATESSFRHTGNPNGGMNPFKPHGIMQVAGRWHPEKFPRAQVRWTSLSENIEIGTKVLLEYIKMENGDVISALQRYNGARDDGQLRYARRVAGHFRELKERLQG